MGYHPETLVCSFPPYRGILSRLKPWIGFDVWHIDPERRGTGNRTDDSCGWFDRTPGEYADAVEYLIKDETFQHEVKLILLRRVNTPAAFYEGISDEQIYYPRLSAADTLAACLMVARYLELRRWWNGEDGKGGAHANKFRQWFTRKRKVDGVAFDLALGPFNNLSSIELADQFTRCIAAALNRHFQRWWTHPRWHVFHWEIKFDLTRNIKRMAQKCATCGNRLGFGYCPTDDGSGRLHHGDCLGFGGPCSTERDK